MEQLSAEVRSVLAARLAHQHEVATRVEPVTAPTELDRIEERMRALAAIHQPVATGLGLYNGGFPQVQVDELGRPVNTPTGVAAELLARWEARPDLHSGAPCGPQFDRFALALDDEGWAWLRKVSGVPRMSASKWRMRDQLQALGIPDTAVHPQECREPCGQHVILSEVMGPAPVARVTVLPVTDDVDEFNRLTMASMRPQSRGARWLVWRWPAGWTLPGAGKLSGVRVLDAVPSNGAVVRVDGARLCVMNFARPFDHPPTWLLAALGAKPDRRAA